MNREVAKKLEDLPVKSGVYFHKDKTGKLIYVGKAANLRNRVRQYFQDSTLEQAHQNSPKTAVHIGEIADIDWVETDSEIEALFLEAELIKRYKPKFNVDLRDDKSNSFIRIDINSDHPTVILTRRPLDDGAQYFGPYISSHQLGRALKQLRKIFPYDTKKSVSKRVSLDYHIGLSPGLEEDRTSLEQYRSNLRKLMSYLRGNRTQLMKQIEKTMEQASKDRDYEKATQLRNQLFALESLKTKVIFGDEEFIDISKDQALNGLQDLLGLNSPPHRIEGYDISHMQGTNNVASMVVFSNGIPDKAQYRKFKMRLPGNDDFGHMREVISRRFSGRNIESWPKPDLLLIDGGKGQVSSAREVLKDRKIDIPLIGLAKRYETIIIPDAGDSYKEIILGEDSNITKLLQRIRDESHRFAISYHSTLKVKAQTKSQLEEIPGIGPASRRRLIKHFGSIKQVAGSTQAELAKIVGTVKAEAVYSYLHESKTDE